MATPRFHIPQAPDAELNRSPAAALIGRLAADSGLLLSHFEHRHHLPGPDDWIRDDRPDLAGVPVWRGGRLVEHKFQHFRGDNPVGSFHPGHRAKWTAHELCHGVVGFAWAPDASPLFHVLAARLNEVVPVALYYFFDEAHLQRCPLHQGGGPLFGTWCPACEAAALRGPVADDPQAARWRAEGRAYVEGELAAIERAARTGDLAPHRHATLELESDGFAYVASHLPRLQSPVFARFLERFHGPHTGWHRDLTSLADRVRQLTAALADGAPPPPAWPAPRSAHIAQDVAWRLLEVSLDCGGDAAHQLQRLADGLADAPTDLAGAVAGYRALSERFYLPPAEALFAVGYDLVDGLGRDVPQVVEGISQICPHTEALLGDHLDVEAHRFVHGEAPTRGPVARRFAAWLHAHDPGVIADVCRYEAATAHPEPSDPAAEGFADAPGADTQLRRVRGLEVLELSVDPRAVVDALEGDDDAPVEISETPVALAVRRRAGGDVLVAELSADAVAALERLRAGPLTPEALGLPTAELDALRQLGLVLPARFALTR